MDRSATDAAQALVGTVLGKDYRVVAPIGRGGMAVVYLVEHQKLHKEFAAKVLSQDLAKNLEARARFSEEAHAASQLDHENIVGISDFGVTADQRPYFVMELLRGHTLDQRLAAEPMTIEEVYAVAMSVGRALAYAHAEGIVHRDVKPENVFLVQRRQGRWGVKVVDFGIAKTPLNDRLTKLGETLGSPHYMSPEACRGDEVDQRADIYSFGVLLYLMLCGRVPFDHPDLHEVMKMQERAPLPAPTTVNPQLAPALAAVLERALAKRVDDRYAEMEDLLSDLEAGMPPGADQLLVEMRAGVLPARHVPIEGSGEFAASQSVPVMRASRPILVAREGTPAGPPASPTLNPGMAVAGGLTPTPSVASPRSRGPRNLAIAAGVLGLAGVITVLVLSKGQATAPSASADPTPVRAPSTEPPRSGGDGAAAPVAPAPLPPREVGPARATSIKLHVASSPAGASVMLDGEPLGTTPLDLEMPTGAPGARLVLSRSGHERAERTLDLSVDTSVSVELAPLEAAPRPASKPRGVDKPVRATPPAPTPKPQGDSKLDILRSR